MASARNFGPPVADMTFFWLLSSCCVLSAGLFGYGLGYLHGARDTITVNVPDGDGGLSDE
jgi:hypothetical protein